METRDQELSFGTEIYRILFIIDEDISSLKTPGYLADPVNDGWLVLVS